MVYYIGWDLKIEKEKETERLHRSHQYNPAKCEWLKLSYKILCDFFRSNGVFLIIPWTTRTNGPYSNSTSLITPGSLQFHLYLFLFQQIWIQIRLPTYQFFQVEKELQSHKSRVLASKLANIRAMEQRCLLFDRKIASQNFKILSLKSQIENLEAKYDSLSQEIRCTIVAIRVVFNLIPLVWLHWVWEFWYFTI